MKSEQMMPQMVAKRTTLRSRRCHERIEVNATKAEDRIEADVFTEVLKAETAENEIEAKSVLEGTRMALDLIKENNKE